MKAWEHIHKLTEIVLTDNELMNDKLKEQIKKALTINNHLTSCYRLNVTIQDIHSVDSKTSGFYFMLEGTRCGVNFFLNNDLEIVRKPNKNKVTVLHEYNINDLFESFWYKNF